MLEKQKGDFNNLVVINREETSFQRLHCLVTSCYLGSFLSINSCSEFLLPLMTLMFLLHRMHWCGWQQACYPTCSPAVWMQFLRPAAWELIPKPRWPQVAGMLAALPVVKSTP